MHCTNTSYFQTERMVVQISSLIIIQNAFDFDGLVILVAFVRSPFAPLFGFIFRF